MVKSGTTATILFVTRKAVIVANIGDSSAILSRGTVANDTTSYSLQLTVDHIASNPIEKHRIERLGGFVESSGGISRVNGTLAISRSIGDAPLEHFLSRTPHV